MLGERGDHAVAIEDHSVVVVGRCIRQKDLDVESLRRLGEAVEESVVGLLVGTQQELALRAAPRDQVEPARKDLARQGHDTRSGRIRRFAIDMRICSARSRPATTL